MNINKLVNGYKPMECNFIPNITRGNNRVLQHGYCIEVQEDGQIKALGDFKLNALLEINYKDKGGLAQNLTENSTGLRIGDTHLKPVAWVKEGSSHDFGNKDIARDILWCNLADKLQDSYVDEEGEDRYMLKEDHPNVLWLLDDLDAFISTNYQLNVSKVIATTDKILTPVDDNGKICYCDRGQLASLNADTHTLTLAINTIIDNLNNFVDSWNKRFLNHTIQHGPLFGDKNIYFHALVALAYVHALTGDIDKSVAILEEFNNQTGLKYNINMVFVEKYRLDLKK